MCHHVREVLPQIDQLIKYAISRACSSIFIDNSNLNARCSARVGLIEEMGYNPPKNPASMCLKLLNKQTHLSFKIWPAQFKTSQSASLIQ